MDTKLTDVMDANKGFIFVNSKGQYAVTSLSGGFGPTREIINWTVDINSATVFPHEAMACRKFEVLAKCQSLKVVVKREVLVHNWNNEMEGS